MSVIDQNSMVELCRAWRQLDLEAGDCIRRFVKNSYRLTRANSYSIYETSVVLKLYDELEGRDKVVGEVPSNDGGFGV